MFDEAIYGMKKSEKHAKISRTEGIFLGLLVSFVVIMAVVGTTTTLTWICEKLDDSKIVAREPFKFSEDDFKIIPPQAQTDQYEIKIRATWENEIWI